MASGYKQECVCGAVIDVTSPYGGPYPCPRCPLVWDYDEAVVPTCDSIKAAIAAARADQTKGD